MSIFEYRLGNVMVASAEDGFSIRENLESRKPVMGYDLDLLYVECRLCGKPVLWDKGKTSLLLNASGVDTSMLDAECLLLSEGCPVCHPAGSPFHLQVVRVTSVTPQDFLLLSDHKGTA